MKAALFFLILALIAIVVGCGSEVIQGPKGEPGPAGDSGFWGGYPPAVEEAPDFVGEYYLDYDSELIITENHENEYTVDATLVTLNPDGTLCDLDLNASYIDLHSGVIRYRGAVGLSKGQCDSDQGATLYTKTGTSYEYEAVISFDDSDMIVVTLKIFQLKSGVRTMVISRELGEGL